MFVTATGRPHFTWRRIAGVSRDANLFTASINGLHKSISTSRSYSTEDDNKDGKKSSKDKLNDLLQAIVKDSQARAQNRKEDVPKVDFKLAVPIREKKGKPKLVETTEAATVTLELKEEPKLSPKLLSAVKTVAANLEGDPQVTENELVQKLKTQQAAKINLSELFLGMKIDRTPKAVPTGGPEMEASRAQRVRRILGENVTDQHDLQRRQLDRYTHPERLQPPQSYAYNPIDLFGTRPLGIFTQKKDAPPAEKQESLLSTWDKIHEKELKLAATHPPANGFDEMILWTEQGKLWKFPIDNEQGIEEEETKYDFTDHVFLEPLVDSWCPKKGPIRHFMELVRVAISKNPYLTVPEKHEYLNWYGEYFRGKSQIIKEVGAGEIH